MQKAEADADQRRLAEKAVAEEHANLVARRRSNAEQLPPPIAELDATMRCKLVLRLPSGKRTERIFDAEDRVAAVYSWADCCGELAGLDGQRFDVPRQFYLATTYPKVELRD